jgi:hypothetical protein
MLKTHDLKWMRYVGDGIADVNMRKSWKKNLKTEWKNGCAQKIIRMGHINERTGSKSYDNKGYTGVRVCKVNGAACHC